MRAWVFALAAVAGAPTARADVRLDQGRYLGWIDPGGGDPKVAVVMDLFVVQPNDPDQFPVASALLRVSLGGLQGGEYETEFYQTIQYDYSDGVLSMGDATNDLAISGQVSWNATEQSVIDAQVLVRSAGVSGQLHLVEASTAPGADPGTLAPDQYKPELAGSYAGPCGSTQALLQLEVGRGLGGVPTGQHGLDSYAIQGRLGTDSGIIQPPGPLVYLTRAYGSGAFSVFKNQLTLTAAGGADTCMVTGTHLSCSALIGRAATQCELDRAQTSTGAPRFYARGVHIAATAAQLMSLPQPLPPANTDLINALEGDFTGYLHHEASDHYQVVQMHVLAYSSTDNPHNENLVYVSGATSMHFGAGVSGAALVQQFEPRSFYLAPGFTLTSTAADAFVIIDDWRQGYLEGVLYSRAYGRVGTVELVKGTDLPAIGGQARFIPAIAGTFSGPIGKAGGENLWQADLIVPTQSSTAAVSTLAFQGQARRSDGATPPLAIGAGVFDFYSGALAWTTADSRMIAGTVVDGPALALFWPNAPALGSLMDVDHGAYLYPWQ